MIDIFDGDTTCLTETLSTESFTTKLGKWKFLQCVSFAETVQVQEIPNTSSLTKKERTAMWYPEPTIRSKNNLMKLILCGQRRESTDDGGEIDLCGNQRGFRYTESLHDDSVPFSISAVLAEQESRRESGQRVDPDEIAKIYRRCCSHSAVRAQMRAMEVANDANEYILQAPRYGHQRIVIIEETRMTEETRNKTVASFMSGRV